MLYIESPAWVGFSYSDDKMYVTNDTEVSLLPGHLPQSLFPQRWLPYRESLALEFTFFLPCYVLCGKLNQFTSSYIK